MISERTKIREVWRNLKKRYTTTRPSYKDCSVSSEWGSYDNFYNWYISQPYYAYKDKFKLNIDKDLLILGNKHYSEKTCVLLPQYINIYLNSLLKNSKGYYFHSARKRNKPWYINFKGKRKQITKYFKTEEEAHLAYLIHKIKDAERVQKRFKTKEIDIRIHNAFEACIDNLREEVNSLQESLAKPFIAPIMPV